MDGQPEILTAGPRDRWPRLRPGRPAIAAALAVVLLACLGALAYTAVQLTQRDSTIHELRAGLRATQQRTAATGSVGLPALSGSTMTRFPDPAGGAFSMVAAAIRPRPGAPPLTWVFVYGQHATPGARYSLLDGTCGGQYVTPAAAAQGIADTRGDLTIAAPNLPLSARDRDAWVLVYRASDGVTLGGLRGPFAGGHPVPFRTTPPC